MSHQYHVGQKVTMIAKTGFWVAVENLVMPVYGVVYTIRDMHFQTGFGLFLQFVEIKNPSFDYGDDKIEAFFEAKIFRPVVDRPNDTEAFIKALNIDGISKKVIA